MQFIIFTSGCYSWVYGRRHSVKANAIFSLNSRCDPFVFSTVCFLIEKLSLSKMPFKNDPVISKFILESWYCALKRLCFLQLLSFTSLMLWRCVSAGWQWLIDDTIKTLHPGVKDSTVVRFIKWVSQHGSRSLPNFLFTCKLNTS